MRTDALIVLIGLPGSGKSTVGRQLARRFSFSFFDSDHVIEQRLGCSIREFFEREGEERFRDVEQEVIAQLVGGATPTAASLAPSAGAISASMDAPKLAAGTSGATAGTAPASSVSMVLSTGGGAVLRPANRAALRASGHVVYLRATPEDLYRRLRYDQNRPLLQGGDPLQKLRDLYAARDPLYRETAHFTVDTGRPSVASLTNMIAMQLELAGVVPTPGP